MIKLNSFFKGNKIIPITVLSGIFLGATFFGFPKLSSVFKPVVGRFNETNLGVITDSESGEIFSFIESDTGEKRFVKLDKTPEREVRNINRKISNLKEEISSLKADRAEIDILNKNTKIFMENPNKKVQINNLSRNGNN